MQDRPGKQAIPDNVQAALETIGSALEQSCQAGPYLESLAGLREKLREGLRLLRERYERPTAYLRDVDPVLEYVFGIVALIPQAADKSAESVKRWLSSRFAEYDAVLGKLLPEDLRLWARDKHAALMFDAGENLTAADDWNVTLARIEADRHQPRIGIATGLKRLDEATNGLEGLTVVAGDRGVGKTTLALSILLDALEADPDLAVIYYSLDMPKQRILERILCRHARISYRELKAQRLNEDLSRRLAASSAELRDLYLSRLRIVDRFKPSELETDRSLADIILGQAQSLVQTSNSSNLLIVIDLHQNLPRTSPPPNEYDDDNHVAQIDIEEHRLDVIKEIQRRTRTDRHPYGTPLLVVSEVRKASGPRARLHHDDVLGSGHLASMASTILLLWPRESGGQSREGLVPMTLDVAKGRDGCERGELPLWFDNWRYRFYDEQPRAVVRADLASRTAKAAKTIDPLASGRKRGGKS